MTGKIVAWCIENGKTLESMTVDEYKSFSPVFDDGVYAAINLENCVAARKVVGGPSPEAVAAQIESIKAFISSVEND